MKVFWWQAGLHIEPENDEDRKALTTLESILKLTPMAQTAGTVGEGSSYSTTVNCGQPAESSNGRT